MSNALRIFRRKFTNPDAVRPLQQTLSAFAGCVLTLLCLSSCGCMEPALAADQPAVQAQQSSPVAADVLVATERLKFEQDSQPVLPDDLGGNKQALPPPPQIGPGVTHPPYVPGPSPSPLPVVQERRQILAFVRTRPVQRCDGRRCTFDTSERDACAGLPAVWDSLRKSGWEVRANGGHVHTVDIDEHPEAAKQWGVQKCPTLILTVNRQPHARFETDGSTMTAPEITRFYSEGSATTFRPREQWRSMLPRGTPADVSTDTEEAISLPTTRINLAGQAIEFIDSKESRLNRWFSVVFRAGNIKHQGNSVVFSAPPEMRLHFTEGGAGVRLDSLKSIEFVPGGANLHLSIGVIPFRVRGK